MTRFKCGGNRSQKEFRLYNAKNIVMLSIEVIHKGDHRKMVQKNILFYIPEVFFQLETFFPKSFKTLKDFFILVF